jgi:hypothetical protein
MTYHDHESVCQHGTHFRQYCQSCWEERREDTALMINGVVWATYPTPATARARMQELRDSGVNATIGRVTR